METEVWCQELHDSFKKLGLGWPLLQKGKISSEQAEEVEKLMNRFTVLAEDEDLSFVSSVWSEKYKLFRPYLETDDVEGFNLNIDEADKTEMHLANLSISNFCGWDEW